MVPDIWSMTDNFLSFWTVFYPFPPLWTENQNFEKMKKRPEDIIILQVCTTNDSHMMYGSWDMECNEQNFLSFWTVFFPFTPLTTQNIKILKKWQKNTWRYYHFTQVYHKWQSYDVWFLRYPWQTECFVILDHFLPSHPKNQNFEKTKKNPGDIILHMCTINDNHMMYGSWDTCNREILMSFWTIFCIFTPLTTQNIKILEKMKKNSYRSHHFTHVYHKLQSYDVWFLGYGVWRTEFFVIVEWK